MGRTERLTERGEPIVVTATLEYLPQILARQILASNVICWSPDFLSRQMADDIAWQIGERACIETSGLKTLNRKGASHVIRLTDTTI